MLFVIMRVLVTGSAGQLGSRIARILDGDAAFDVVALPRASLDITRTGAAHAAVRAIRPAWVINCAAFTDVERAEIEREEARLLNDVAVGTLADAAHEAGARLLHFSTDYVFSGDFADGSPRPYREEDPTGPINLYGASKLGGELRLHGHAVRSTIVRTSWLYGGPGRNFLDTILERGAAAARKGEPLRVVDDQRGSPTDVGSLAIQVKRILEEDISGLYHASAAGEATWFEVARGILEAAGIPAAIEPITSAEYPTRARRPRYSVLASRRLETLDVYVLPHWREGLERELRARRKP
jgi:dTDP-4-dehydrorhamnose reductase